MFSQLGWRTVVRRLQGAELWNGNVEPPLSALFTDPDHVVRYAWSTYARRREQMLAVLASPDSPPVVRLRSRRDVRRWLAGPAVR